MKLLIEKIQVNGRHRRDMGDIASLADSINRVGLLHPVVVTTDNRLIAGERRMAAARKLGWKEIEASVAGSLDDAASLLIAERDENTCRKDFTPSEAVAVGKLLEELERPKAKERQREGGSRGGKSGGEGSVKFTEPSGPKSYTRDIVGEQVGMSGVTYQRAKAVVAAAEKDPEKFAPLVAEMDRTGKVNTSYNQLRDDREKQSPSADEAAAAVAVMPKRAGRGIELAHKAIGVLKSIPANDALREEGLRTVARWIKDNK